MEDFKEKRKHRRVEGIFKITADFMPGVPMKFTCHSSDISEAGMRVNVPKNPPVGSGVLVMFDLPNHQPKRLAIRGVVAWASELIRPELKQGRSYLYEAGIKFVDLDKEDRDAIRSYIDERLE